MNDFEFQLNNTLWNTIFEHPVAIMEKYNIVPTDISKDETIDKVCFETYE